MNKRLTTDEDWKYYVRRSPSELWGRINRKIEEEIINTKGADCLSDLIKWKRAVEEIIRLPQFEILIAIYGITKIECHIIDTFKLKKKHEKYEKALSECKKYLSKKSDEIIRNYSKTFFLIVRFLKFVGKRCEDLCRLNDPGLVIAILIKIGEFYGKLYCNGGGTDEIELQSFLIKGIRFAAEKERHDWLTSTDADQWFREYRKDVVGF